MQIIYQYSCLPAKHCGTSNNAHSICFQLPYFIVFLYERERTTALCIWLSKKNVYLLT